MVLNFIKSWTRLNPAAQLLGCALKSNDLFDFWQEKTNKLKQGRGVKELHHFAQVISPQGLNTRSFPAVCQKWKPPEDDTEVKHLQGNLIWCSFLQHRPSLEGSWLFNLCHLLWSSDPTVCRPLCRPTSVHWTHTHTHTNQWNDCLLLIPSKSSFVKQLSFPSDRHLRSFIRGRCGWCKKLSSSTWCSVCCQVLHSAYVLLSTSYWSLNC